MKDDNQNYVQKYQLTTEQIKDFVDKTTDKNVKMIWNAAIEEAAMSVGTLPYSTEACAVIRGLKK